MTSLKKLTAILAVSLPLAAAAQTAPAAPAAPPKPAVTVYGTFNVNLQAIESPGSTNTADNVDDRLAVSIDSTNIGFRAAADVAYGLSVVAQCESAATIDAGLGNICNRNSRIGVTSPFGTLFLGRWDTPFKAAWYGTKADDPFGNTDTAAASAIMGSPGFRTRSGNPQGWDQRATDSVAYHSPKFMGVSVKLQHQVNEGANRTDTVSPRLWGAGVNYDAGPFSVGAAYERHDDFAGLDVINATTTTFGASVRNLAPTATGGHNSVDQAWRVAAGYELATPFGTTTIGAAVEQLMYEQENATTGQLKDYDRLAYQVSLKHRLGKHEFRARYNLADEGDCTIVGGGSCNTNDFGAQNITLGYTHYLSNAAQVYAFWTQIMNDMNASYTFGVAGAAAVVDNVGAGADPWSAGVGMRYAF
jgi:predicted porin